MPMLRVLVVVAGIVAARADPILQKLKGTLNSDMAQNVMGASQNVMGALQDTASAAASATSAVLDGSGMQISSMKEFIQKIQRGQATQMDFMDIALNSEGFQELLKEENTDVLREILDSQPLMAAIPSFKAARDGIAANTISATELSQFFMNGMQESVGAMRQVLTKVSSPDDLADIAMNIANDQNADVMAKLQAARSGDGEAVKAITDLYNQAAFPGVDASVMDELTTPEHGQLMMEQLWGMEDIMRQIDMDKTMSDVMRKGGDYKGWLASLVPGGATQGW